MIEIDDHGQTEEICHEQIDNAIALQFMVGCEGWTILLNSMEEKKQRQIDELISLPPGNDESVLRAHAVAFAVAHTVDDISRSVASAIQQGEAAKAVLRELKDLQPEPEEDY